MGFPMGDLLSLPAGVFTRRRLLFGILAGFVEMATVFAVSILCGGFVELLLFSSSDSAESVSEPVGLFFSNTLGGRLNTFAAVLIDLAIFVGAFLLCEVVEVALTGGGLSGLRVFRPSLMA